MGRISQLNLPLALHSTEPHLGVTHSGFQQRNFHSLYLYMYMYVYWYQYFIQWGFQFSLVWLVIALPVDFLMFWEFTIISWEFLTLLTQKMYKNIMYYFTCTSPGINHLSKKVLVAFAGDWPLIPLMISAIIISLLLLGKWQFYVSFKMFPLLLDVLILTHMCFGANVRSLVFLNPFVFSLFFYKYILE